MDSQKQVVDKLKDANNILVTVQSSPSIDALSACIGLTLFLNELGKHATAVFSGQVPHVLEFLQPEKTIETNTNSLRDFIISLDKSKADKLRYKVEDKVVKIFITPYRTSITDRDLEFSQGDFNVDVVVAIGVHSQDELDQAITAHGRILHDATVISVNVNEGDTLGSIDWNDKDASSLSEMTASLVDPLGKDKLDNQIATAFLTGIVEQTERFSNNKTTPKTMSISAKLLTAGANQELVASKLADPTPEPEEHIEEPFERQSDKEEEIPSEEAPMPRKAEPGTLEIDHSHDDPFAEDVAAAAESAPLKPEETANSPRPKAPEPLSPETRQKRIEPIPANDAKPPLSLEDTPAEMKVVEQPAPQPGQSVSAAKPEPVVEPQTAPAEPEVSDEAVDALRALQRAQAEKAKAQDSGDVRQAEIQAQAEKAAEDFLRNKQINIDDAGHLRLMTPEHRQFLGEASANADVIPSAAPDEKPSGSASDNSSKFVLSPPSMGGTLTANSRPEDSVSDPTTDPFSTPKSEAPMLQHDGPEHTPPLTLPKPVADHSKSIEPLAPTLAPEPGSDKDDAESARTAIKDAVDTAPPESTINADPLARTEEKIVSNPNPATPEPLISLDDSPAEPEEPVAAKPAATPYTPPSEPLTGMLTSEDDDTPSGDKPMDMPLPPSLNLPAPNLNPATGSPSASPSSPPPVPPPMMPQPSN